MRTGKIRAKYKNGVIEPLEKISLPEGQELEVDFRSVPTTEVHSLSEEEIRREFIEQSRHLFKGVWGKTVEEINAYIQAERKSWDRGL